RSEQYSLLVDLSRDLGVQRTLQIDDSTLLGFYEACASGYPDNPYHNFVHALDVTVILHRLLRELGAGVYLTPLDVAVTVLAAVCHDVGHPGVNNLYHVHARTELAVRYKNESILENHSCHLAWELIQSHGLLDALQPPSPSSSKSFFEIILATDMRHHFSLLDEVHGMVESFTLGPMGLAFRRRLCAILLHAADVSNPVRSWSECKEWSDAITTEFRWQGERERREGLPVSPGMDVESTSPGAQARSAIEFNEVVIRPYFTALAEFLPKAHIFLDDLNSNLRHWRAIAAS
ncbi:MAG: hypothetical protein DHS80DRAFT_1254, partial [Piptocephalis tieghemiana]